MLGQVPLLSDAFVVGPGFFAYTTQVGRGHYVGSICTFLMWCFSHDPDITSLVKHS
jgi:hypothetical protein